MKIFLFIVAIAAVIFGITFSAYALDYTADATLSAAEQYNDNLFLTNTNRTYDYITLITPSITLSTKTEKADVKLNYAPTFNIYSDHSKFDYTAEQAFAQGHYAASENLSLGVSDLYVQTKDNSTIRAIAGAGPVFTGQERLTYNTVNGDLAYKLSGKVTLLGNAIYTLTDTQSGTGDGSNYTGGLGATYLLNDRTTLRANAAYTFYHYSVSGDATTGSYTLGVNYKLTPTIIADAFGGAYVINVDQPKSSNTGFTGGVTLTKTFARGSTVAISYLQNIIAAFESNAPIRQETFTFKLTSPVTPSLTGSVAVYYSQFTSFGNAQVSGTNFVDTNRNDWGGEADASYKLLSWLSAFASYTYVHSIDRLTNSDSYINNIVMAGLKLQKQVKF